jgi:hypothetical protein
MAAGADGGPISAICATRSGGSAEQGGDKFASAADAEFVEDGS